MRRNFAQVLKMGKIDIKSEYTKFYNLFYVKDERDNNSIAEIVSNHFLDYHFRGTCLSLDEFNRVHGFEFVEDPTDFNEDYLVSFMEYMYNLIMPLHGGLLFHNMNKSFYLEQVRRVVEVIGYMMINEEGIIIIVPKDNNAIAVAESNLIPDDLSYKVLQYNHHSLKGNIDSKRDILLKFSNVLEGKRGQLETINRNFSSDLFQLLNKCNIRHNNKDASSKNYCKYIADVPIDDLEGIYDEVYQMCLLACMQLEHMGRKEWLDNIKYNLNNVN